MRDEEEAEADASEDEEEAEEEEMHTEGGAETESCFECIGNEGVAVPLGGRPGPGGVAAVVVEEGVGGVAASPEEGASEVGPVAAADEPDASLPPEPAEALLMEVGRS